MSEKTVPLSKVATSDVVYTGSWTNTGVETPASQLTEASASGASCVVKNLVGDNYVGIQFELGTTHGIARINLYNKSINSTDTGDTHTNTTLDNLTDTSALVVGMLIEGSGIPAATKISTIDSATQVTMTKAATATASGIGVTFSQCDVNNQLVDTYISATGGEAEYVYWMKCAIPANIYEMHVEHNGTHNASASSTYSIDIVKFQETALLTNAADIEPTLYLYHTDHSGYEESYVIASAKEVTDLDKTVSVVANGTDTVFQLTGSGNRAYAPTDIGQKASAAPDITWNGIFNPDVSWGNNSPNYDDETIDSDGHYYVKFDVAPDAGFVYFKFIPKADQFKVITQIKHADDGSTYIENREVIRLLDHGIELIPHDS